MIIGCVWDISVVTSGIDKSGCHVFGSPRLFKCSSVLIHTPQAVLYGINLCKKHLSIGYLKKNKVVTIEIAALCCFRLPRVESASCMLAMSLASITYKARLCFCMSGAVTFYDLSAYYEYFTIKPGSSLRKTLIWCWLMEFFGIMNIIEHLTSYLNLFKLCLVPKRGHFKDVLQIKPWEILHWSGSNFRCPYRWNTELSSAENRKLSPWQRC